MAWSIMNHEDEKFVKAIAILLLSKTRPKLGSKAFIDKLMPIQIISGPQFPLLPPKDEESDV